MDHALPKNALLVASLMAMAALIVLPIPALAGGLPWLVTIKKVETSLETTVAKDVATIAIVITGLLISFAEVDGILGRLISLLFGLSFLMLAAQWVKLFSIH